MGKWASGRRRGGAQITGQLAAPRPASMTVGTVAATSIQVNFSDPLPSAANQYGAMAVNVATGVQSAENIGPSSPRTVGGLTTLTAYRVYGAWFLSGSRISDWQFAFAQTTP